MSVALSKAGDMKILRGTVVLRVLAIAMLLSQAGAWAQAGATVAEQYLLAMANQERAALGLQALAWDGHLATAARRHAERMAAERGIGHQFAGEAELGTRAKAAGARFSLVAENVAMGQSPQQLHTMWMNSEGHRHNLLEPVENAVGISVVRRGGDLYAVEDFSAQVELLSIAEQERRVAEVLRGAGMENVAATADARATCRMETGYAGAVKPWFVMRYLTSNLNELPKELKSQMGHAKYKRAAVGACTAEAGAFSAYSIVVLLYP